MFSLKQKQKIAEEIEKLLLSFDHPEMPKERPSFHLRVDGNEYWSFADIDPNWTYQNKKADINPHNEAQEKFCKPIE